MEVGAQDQERHRLPLRGAIDRRHTHQGSGKILQPGAGMTEAPGGVLGGADVDLEGASRVAGQGDSKRGARRE